MMQRRHLLILSIGLFAMLASSGCFQYPDGPVFTIMTKDERIDGNWKLTEFINANGDNASDEHQNETLTVIVDRSGNKTWQEFKDAVRVNLATFQFADHSNYVIVEYGAQGQDAIQKFYDIRKLTEKEFKFVDDQGNTLDYKKY